MSKYFNNAELVKITNRFCKLVKDFGFSKQLFSSTVQSADDGCKHCNWSNLLALRVELHSRFASLWLKRYMSTWLNIPRSIDIIIQRPLVLPTVCTFNKRLFQCLCLPIKEHQLNYLNHNYTPVFTCAKLLLKCDIHAAIQ